MKAKTKSSGSEGRYVALLRGINVGGNNLIKMVDLRGSFAKMGFGEVETYIQSGNVVFSSKQTNKAKLTEMIEKAFRSVRKEALSWFNEDEGVDELAKASAWYFVTNHKATDCLESNHL